MPLVLFHSLKAIRHDEQQPVKQKVYDARIISHFSRAQNLIVGIGKTIAALGWVLISIPNIHIAATLFHDGLCLATQAAVSVRAVKKGSRVLQTALLGASPTIPPITRFKNGVIGLGLVVLGGAGILSALGALRDLGQGFFSYRSLDPENQHLIIKHDALHGLNQPKEECRAVLIDGLSSEWGKSIMDDLGSPLSKAVHHRCGTRAVRVNSGDELCKAVQKESEILGGPLDLLVLSGHGFPGEQRLGKDYILEGNNLGQIACIAPYIQPNAQIIVQGCYSAHPYDSLIDKIATLVPGREVVGFPGPSYQNSEYIAEY